MVRFDVSAARLGTYQYGELSIRFGGPRGSGRQLLPVREVWRARHGAATVRDQAAPFNAHRAPEAFRVRPEHHEQAQAEPPLFVPHGAGHVALDVGNPRGGICMVYSVLYVLLRLRESGPVVAFAVGSYRPVCVSGDIDFVVCGRVSQAQVGVCLWI